LKDFNTESTAKLDVTTGHFLPAHSIIVMDFYEKILGFITGWTLIEGVVVLCWPRGAMAVTQKLFPKWGGVLSEMELPDLRKMGLVEMGFGLLLGGYLLWAA
jgi:hypothetical protein